MVVSKVEFNDALREINVSYAKVFERLEKLEEQIKALEEKAKPATRKKAAGASDE